MKKWLYALPLLTLAWAHQVKAADIEAGNTKAIFCADDHGMESQALIQSRIGIGRGHLGCLIDPSDGSSR